MQNQLTKKKTILISTSMILLLLSIPPASAFSTHDVSSTRTEFENVSEPVYGGGGVHVWINEIYGSPDDPQYRPFSNVTVKIWHTWFFKGNWFISLIRKCIIGSTFFPDHLESFILNTTIDGTKLTNEEGYCKTYMQGICVLWLFYPIKEGYHVYGSTPFKESYGGGGLWETVNFVMAEDGGPWE